jgi:hypothetical protein
MSAMPFSVFSPRVSWSSALMPRARSSATSPRMPLTCLAAWVCWSAVSTVLLVTSRWVPLPHPEQDGVLVFPDDRQPELAVVELSGCGEVGGQEHGGDRVLSKRGMSLLLSGRGRLTRAGCWRCGRTGSGGRTPLDLGQSLVLGGPIGGPHAIVFELGHRVDPAAGTEGVGRSASQKERPHARSAASSWGMAASVTLVGALLTTVGISRA